MQQVQQDSLSPEKLQMFVAGLTGLAPDEVRKAKVLYLRNAISELEALQLTNEAMGKMQGCMSIVPIFWPIIGAQKRMMAAQIKLSGDRIRNAVEVWRDDLKGEKFVIDGENVMA